MSSVERAIAHPGDRPPTAVKREWVSLMYHDVMEDGAPVSAVAQRFAVPVTAFAAQLDALREGGYLVRSLCHAIREPDTKVVAMTFDDGHVGQFARAFPELVARGMSATFFVTTSWIGRRPGYCSWSQLREMNAAGMSIQSHTHSHPFLSELPAHALSAELCRSKAELDEALGQDTDAIALPGGDHPRRRLRPLLAESGYAVVATSQWGTNGAVAFEQRGPRYIRRCTIRGTPDNVEFARILAGDPALAHRLQARAALLGAVRRMMGPSRYARWRAMMLDRADSTVRALSSWREAAS